MPNITPEMIALGLVWYVVFLLALTCHEGAHALVAKWGGDPTAFEGGQVTLNPIPHMRREPIGTMLVPILSYALAGWMIGWASAPYDPLWAQRHPRRSALMALAGPAANFILMFLAAVGIRIGLATGDFRVPESVTFSHLVDAANPGTMGFLATFLSILFMLNLLLGTFNLLPVPPLDGNTGITLLMPGRAAIRFLGLSRSFGMLGLLVAWVVFGRVFDDVFRLALTLLFPGSAWR